MTTTEKSPAVLPTERCYGLGELIYAHRLYMGLSQRGMARRLEFDRRDYQRIEQGRNECPVGFLTKVTALVDEFDNHVDNVVQHARENGGAVVKVDTDPRWEWERNVAGRAALIGAAAAVPTTVTLALMSERSAR